MEIPKSAAKPPGEKLVKRMSLRTKWILLSISGFILLIYGLVTFQHSTLLHDDATQAKWVLSVIYSIALITTGVVLITQATRFRVLLDVKTEIRRAFKQMPNKLSSKKKLRDGRKARKKTKNPTKQD